VCHTSWKGRGQSSRVLNPEVKVVVVSSIVLSFCSPVTVLADQA